MATGRRKVAWAAASLVVAAGAASAAWADDCWTDVTTHGCAAGGWHQLQFRNDCNGGTRLINVCVKWTSGASAGVVNRLAASAASGGVALIQPGMCDNGDISYTYRVDGSVPGCPK